MTPNIPSTTRETNQHSQSTLKNQALISNLWVILATIVASALLTYVFGDENFKEVAAGFIIYFITNSLALVAAYKGHPKLALMGYTTQVFLVTTIAMVLMNEAPAHLVLAMVNFVLLHAVVLGRRIALSVTAVMVALLFVANILGNYFAADIAQMVASGELVLSLSDSTRFTNLITTTMSTGYLIVTTIDLQEKSRAATIEANTQLSLAQQDIQRRLERDQMLSKLGGLAVSATTIDTLYSTLLDILTEALPEYDFELISHIERTPDTLPIEQGPNPIGLSTTPTLAPTDVPFVQNAIRLIESAITRIQVVQRHQKSERLEVIGRLAASVAHDFNNLLVPISGTLDLLETNTSNESTQPARLAVRQVSMLVDKLLVHACSIEQQIEPVDLNAVIRSAEPLLQNFVHDNGTLELDLCPTAIFIQADKIELEQILLNTTLNAIEAMQGTGTIVISTSKHQEQICLSIQDDGPGIPKSIQQWVLEPFHTTKADGSGLGLATVQRIIQDYNGTLEIDSTPNQGTLIRMYLPAAVQPIPKVSAPPYDGPIPSLHILVVDDNPMVAATLAQMLDSLGHTTQITNIPEEATHLLGQTTFDFILMDYQMPGMTGIEVLDEMRQQGYSQPVILISGYGTAIDPSASTPNKILSKPIRLQELKRALKDVWTEAHHAT
jgi:signal transduction histidine kinase